MPRSKLLRAKEYNLPFLYLCNLLFEPESKASSFKKTILSSAKLLNCFKRTFQENQYALSGYGPEIYLHFLFPTTCLRFYLG
jgi:hypothetical protein